MITLPKAIYEEMIGHAKSCYPQEACGFVAGRNGKAGRFLPVENMDQSSISYAMDPRRQMKAFREIDEAKLEFLGIFHSHVASPATPSQKDRTHATYPEASYLIVSLSDMEKPELRSFKIVDEKFTEEKLKIS